MSISLPIRLMFSCAICLEEKKGKPQRLPCCGGPQSSVQYCRCCIENLCQRSNRSTETELIVTKIAKCPTCTKFITLSKSTGNLFQVKRAKCKTCRQQNRLLVSPNRCEECNAPQAWAQKRLQLAKLKGCYYQVYCLQQMLAISGPQRKGIVAVLGLLLLFCPAVLPSFWRYVALGVLAFLYIVALAVGTLFVSVSEYDMYSYFLE